MHVCATRSPLISPDFPGLLQDVPEAEISCGKCHASFYCSKHCRTKDALSHKAVCMRNKLRLKLALKASQLNDWIHTSFSNSTAAKCQDSNQTVACMHVCMHYIKGSKCVVCLFCCNKLPLYSLPVSITIVWLHFSLNYLRTQNCARLLQCRGSGNVFLVWGCKIWRPTSRPQVDT